MFARVLFLLYRDFLLTKWTLRSRKGSGGHLLLCYLLFSPLHTSNTRARPHTFGGRRIYTVGRDPSSRRVETWKEEGQRVRTTGRKFARERERAIRKRGRERERYSRVRADVREGGSARTGQFCPKRAMLEAIDHAISVVRLTRTDRMAEAMGWTRGCRDNWTLTAPEVRVMTLGGASRPMQKRRGRFHPRLPRF